MAGKKRKYRIKAPRCFVIRWYQAPTNAPHEDYLNGRSAARFSGSTCLRHEAKEWPTAAAARAFLDAEIAKGHRTDGYWLIFRRGPVSRKARA